MSTSLSFITDRTAEDVSHAERLAKIAYQNMTEAERSEWDSGMKGAYNAVDLNRVESAVSYLAYVLQELPDELIEHAASKGVVWEDFYAAPYDARTISVETKTDWLVSDMPTPAEMERYLDNVAFLRSVLDYATDELPASMEGLTWDGANAIERALENLDAAIKACRTDKKKLIDNTAAAWIYSGEMFTGEV
ncbi:MAG: hypothetical protein IJY96_01565 [Oscillospiraceae bacterium]|nr:hypothetical protein [Oscillospiraceae bacterium]